MRLAYLAAALCLCGPAVAQPPPADPPAYPTAAVGGVLQLDAGWFAQSARNREIYGDAEDGADFRTARLWARGSLLAGTNYMLEFDFGSLATAAPGRPNFQNAYLEQEHVPYLGTVRVGRWKQPFSLETATSIRFLTFIERANLFAFVPFRRTGVGFFDFSADERWTWAGSVFRSGDDGYGGSLADGGRGWATAGRLTRLLWDESDGTRLLHLGAAHTWNAAPDRAVRFARFPEFGLGVTPTGLAARATPNFFDTGRLPADQYHVFGLEAAWVRGPLSVQAEGTAAVVDRPAGGATAVFPGWYVFGSYFVTGESRTYLRRAGAFDRVTPRRNLVATEAGVTGTGAWELTARLSRVDVTDAGVTGGRLTDLTLGVNWHLNPNAKLQFNYIRAFAAAVAGDSTADVFGLRAAYDF